MFKFLAKDSEMRAWDHLDKNSSRLALIAPLEDLYSIYYDVGQELPIPSYVDNAHAQFRKLDAEGSGRLFLIANSRNEKAALEAFRIKYPGLRFAGLVENFAVALISRHLPALLGRESFEARKSVSDYKLVPIFATPRSGSSYLCDILGNLGVGSPREHLRDPLLGIMTSSYRYDTTAFLRNFCNLAGRNDFVSTKLITHFAHDLVRLGGTKSLAKTGIFAARTFPIFIDRRDKVRQAISGALAGMRKVWHITDDESRKRVSDFEDQPYDFDRILRYYLNYKIQSGIIFDIRNSFSDGISLFYEDILDQDFLREELCRYLEVENTESGIVRQKIAGDINEDFYGRFVSEFRDVFGKAPETVEN